MVGLFKVHSGQHSFNYGQKVNVNLSKYLNDYSQQIHLTDQNGKSLGKNIPYYIFAPILNQEFYGRTDDEGKTERIYTKQSEQLEIKVGKEAKDYLLEKGIEI